MKKKLLISLISSAVAVGGGVGTFIAINANQSPAEIVESEAKYQTTYLEVPTNGTNPLDYDATTNVAYALWQLEQEDSFYTYTRGTSDASVATIQIYSERTDIGDKAITETISDGMISSGSQRYFLDNKVLIRDASKINGLNTTWSNDTPECISYNAFIKRHGTLAFKCGPYIICEETILSASEVKDNGDGTYSFMLELNPASDYAPFWYQRDILTTSGSSIIPQFNFINVEYKINSSWQIQEVHVVEEYKVKAMGIEAASKTDTIEYYSYDNVAFDSNEMAYFSQYESLTPAEDEEDIVREDDVLTMITSSLQNADGSDKVLDIEIEIGENKLDGLVSLNISDLNNVKVKALLNDIYVEYSDAIYLSIGGVKVKATMDDINQIIGVFTSNTLEALDDEAASPALDAAQIIADLNGAEVTKSEDGTDILVSAKLNLLGLELPLSFHFSYIDGNYTLLNAEASIEFEGQTINLSLAQSTDSIPSVDYSTFGELSNLQFVFNEIGSIINEKKLGAKLEVSYDE
ncbi:MAG: hypothetical protein J6R47_01820, partial [Acholeplasmatales bacterium]|nr:hypothetical protein [Acholeplasmatales bacterium]